MHFLSLMIFNELRDGVPYQQQRLVGAGEVMVISSVELRRPLTRLDNNGQPPGRQRNRVGRSDWPSSSSCDDATLQSAIYGGEAQSRRTSWKLFQRCGQPTNIRRATGFPRANLRRLYESAVFRNIYKDKQQMSALFLLLLAEQTSINNKTQA